MTATQTPLAAAAADARSAANLAVQLHELLSAAAAGKVALPEDLQREAATALAQIRAGLEDIADSIAFEGPDKQ